MLKKIVVSLGVALSFVPFADAATEAEQLREEVNALKKTINQLEQRLPQNAAAPRASADSTFNPAMSLILSGGYGRFKQTPEASSVTGFALSGAETGYQRGFALGESELHMSANVDDKFRGVAALAFEPSEGVSVENAFVQTSALGGGTSLRMGRFFSGLGYLNEQHAHARDFIDQPLIYRTFWDGQLSEDGVQLKWLVPTNMFVELGTEVGRGHRFPGSDRNKNGIGATSLFMHLGDDVGANHSWRAGMSLHQTRRVNTESEMQDAFARDVVNTFTGNSKTVGLDFVWKYRTDAQSGGFKLQAEYFRRSNDGELTYDTAGANVGDAFSLKQSGWYAQGLYQFMPRWRIGARYDQMSAGVASLGAAHVGSVIADYAYVPKRATLMLDYATSEFSRFRFQLAEDKSQQGLRDTPIFLQYVMSLGAHGAHKY